MAKQSQALVKWEAELAKEAEAAAAQEAGVGGGSFFSMKGGTLSLNGSPLPNDECAVVILDSVLENAYYTEAFDAENQSTPACYAFGRDPETMAPHEEAESKQCELCKDCEQNQFGSAERGRGKACGNRRRLACIPAGTLSKDGSFEAFDDPDHFAKAQVAYMKLPPTSINGYAAYVKQIAGALKRPPHAIFTKISLVHDEKTMFKVVFELLDSAPNDLIQVLMARHKTEAAAIEFPYPKVEAVPKGGKGHRPEKRARKY